MSAPLVCPYCQALAELVTGKALFEHREDLWRLKFWRCRPCKAHVGCHQGTDRPMGTLANERLRKARTAAHAAFDPLWRSEPHKRSQRYRWLADRLGIHPDLCHVTMFDEATCKRVVAICGEFGALLAAPSLVDQIKGGRLTIRAENLTNGAE